MQIIERSRVFNGHYKVNQLIVQDGDKQLKREQFAPGKAVAALVYDTARQVYVLTRQFRIGPEAKILEIAAGMIDGDEAPETAVRREIQEELGYEVDKLEKIVEMWPSPGTSSELITVYYAEVGHKSGEGGGLAEENENIEMVELSWEALVTEPLQDAKTVLAVQWVRLRGTPEPSPLSGAGSFRVKASNGPARPA
ncbi:NUDIX domain-containing protein [Hymenobacter sp. B1770]|uniref:NUDIX domain-containing protein n=1 Tax=Hymenobacter sp. B1770 TaxID=1718788 RepID=UPI003CECCF60